MARTTVEKIEGIQTQIQQLENERKRLMQQKKEQERKDRTKRLIERGAILESLVPGAAAFSNEQIKEFLEKTLGNESARKILKSMTPQGIIVDADLPRAFAPRCGGGPEANPRPRSKGRADRALPLLLQGRTYIPPSVVSCAPAEGFRACRHEIGELRAPQTPSIARRQALFIIL